MLPGNHCNYYRLPESVESLLQYICYNKCLAPANVEARQAIAELGEEAAVALLNKLVKKNISNLSTYIVEYVATLHDSLLGIEDGQAVNAMNGVVPMRSFRDVSSPGRRLSYEFRVSAAVAGGQESDVVVRQNAGMQLVSHRTRPCQDVEMRHCEEVGNAGQASPQMLALGELEFCKAFLILSYLGRKKLESQVSINLIQKVKHMWMSDFESVIWEEVGCKCIDQKDRSKILEWDPTKTHIYHCHVDSCGSISFKGPFIQLTRNLMQRVLGDDNILLVKFTEETKGTQGSSYYGHFFHKIFEEGILLGLRRYRFFVFKDGGKEEKMKNPTSSPVKCYFIRTESSWAMDHGKPYIMADKFINEARSVFMHVNTVSTLSKYMARFSLILSQTTKFDVDLTYVSVEEIPDIPCRDLSGNIVKDMILSDGTGFISEDLALKCPRNVRKGNYHIPSDIQKLLEGSNVAENSIAKPREPPLLVQFRMFKSGNAVKGTLLLNKQLPPKTIQVRPSMIKVREDHNMSYIDTVDSLEIVQTSNQPRQTNTSRSIILLLKYGGVPDNYFMELLDNALDEASQAKYKKRSAFRVALRHGEMDDFLAARMILCGIPLDEPYLQIQLSLFIGEECKGLKAGRLPLGQSYYLMGTVDPTDTLGPKEVCIILENGPISGKVLVYKHPGLHFGDIHILTAIYKEELNNFVGNSRYAIFFPSKGSRSIADEIANSDYDGDMYWISKNPKLLEYFEESTPWVHPSEESKTWVRATSSKRDYIQKPPAKYSCIELEKKLFQQFLINRFEPSNAMSLAADAWTVYMDRLLTLSDENIEEKKCLKSKILQLVNIYYDALDAPKTGIKVNFPIYLKPEKYPHFLERNNSYDSKSILGLIYDRANEFHTEGDSSNVVITRLPSFLDVVPERIMTLWYERYEKYRKEMAQALGEEHKDYKSIAGGYVILKYKWLLYEAEDFDKSRRNREEIFNESLAIYKVCYDCAISRGDVQKCSFAWKVAGRALCELHAIKQGERPIVCLPSVLREVI